MQENTNQLCFLLCEYKCALLKKHQGKFPVDGLVLYDKRVFERIFVAFSHIVSSNSPSYQNVIPVQRGRNST